MKRPSPKLELLPGETEIVPPRSAVHTDRGKKAGGKLLVTDRRLIFRTNRLDSLFFSSLALDLTAIASVGVASRTLNMYDGGLARRLDVRLTDGTEHLFVLATGGVDEYASKLQALVSQSAEGSDSPGASTI